MLADQEIRHWQPTKGTSKWNADTWTPAYPSVVNGAHTLMINADDVGQFDTLEECADECRERNAAQVSRARREVARLERDLAAAHAHLAKIEALLS